MGARNVLATNLAKKISWGPRSAAKKKIEREEERKRERKEENKK